MSTGIVLFAHGARDPRWAAPFEAVAARLRQRQPATAVRLAFLELMAPDLPRAATELVAAGCTDIVVLPLFLGAGGHVRNDLPKIVQALCAAHPGVRWSLQPPVGELPSVIEAMAGAAVDALAALGSPTPGP